ncbi:MAG: hypothetical protein F7B59_04840 [Desulfurococcales archaeon]|nr:hypothetical protein [Desulfurococcales archaeon]
MTYNCTRDCVLTLRVAGYSVNEIAHECGCTGDKVCRICEILKEWDPWRDVQALEKHCMDMGGIPSCIPCGHAGTLWKKEVYNYLVYCCKKAEGARSQQCRDDWIMGGCMHFYVQNLF